MAHAAAKVDPIDSQHSAIHEARGMCLAKSMLEIFGPHPKLFCAHTRGKFAKKEWLVEGWCHENSFSSKKILSNHE